MVLAEEEKHEDELLAMLDEESLKYAGSVVLGLNDALVELTGALAGLTFAFQNTRLIALAGLITGISAAFSMAASEYLSSKSEGGEKSPLKSAIYTGIAYIITVTILILPYLIAKNYLVSLGWTIANAILVIAVFNFYISVAKGFDFKKRFLEMSLISLGVALFSFVVGNIIRKVFGINV
jgi:VIT1/CCC1 family predicted Fe2+/Mn2+ transporter